MKTTAIGTTFTLAHGTLRVVGFAPGGQSFVTRRELYTSNDDGKTYEDRSMALDTNDASPPNPGYPRARYDARCPSCYLGHPHTTALHDARTT